MARWNRNIRVARVVSGARARDNSGFLRELQGFIVSLLSFMKWLSVSSWSVRLHESQYAYPITESLHVWTLCVFFGLAVLFDLRLLGWALRRVPVAEMSRRLLPWTVGGFILMVITGTLLFSAIPVRTYQNIFFRFKMLLLLLAGLNVWIFQSKVYRSIETWGRNAVPPRSARIAGGLSLILWIGIIISGRMIAYNWFDCDRQPQPAIINSLTGCAPSATND